MEYKKLILDLDGVEIALIENYFEKGIDFKSLQVPVKCIEHNISVLLETKTSIKTAKRLIQLTVLYLKDDDSETINFETDIENLLQLKYLCIQISSDIIYIIDNVNVSLTDVGYNNIKLMDFIPQQTSKSLWAKLKIFHKNTNKNKNKNEIKLNPVQISANSINFFNKIDLTILNKNICKNLFLYREEEEFLTNDIIEFILDKLSYYGYEEVDIDYEILLHMTMFINENAKFKLLNSLTISCLNSLLENEDFLYPQDTINEMLGKII